jgi:glycosyltransferase involved in cell wall biosynthesis
VRIAVNTRLLLKNKLEGIGWFTFESLKRITQQHNNHEFIFIFDRPFHKDFIFSDNITPVVVGPPARHPLLYHIWFNISLKRILKKYKADVLLSPDGYLPLNTKVKTLAVFHDLNFEHYPNNIPPANRYYYKKYFPKFAQKANRLATVSNFSKKDIVNLYKIDESKIDVVFNGANKGFKPLSVKEKHLARKKYTQGKDYFIFIGALNPRKNLVNLLKAFDEFKKADKRDIKLLIVGEKMFNTGETFVTFENMQYKSQVLFTGRLQDNELQNALASALALTYVSYFEGFGIPIVESFYAETPVITSNVTSMPEVAGDAAVLVDPFSIDDIAKALTQLSDNEELRNNLIAKGRERRKIFDWQITADLLWNAIEKTANH